jgi:hypothetical protein
MKHHALENVLIHATVGILVLAFQVLPAQARFGGGSLKEEETGVIAPANALAAGLSSASPESESGAVLSDVGCVEHELAPNDDGSTEAVALPFVVNFFGSQYTETYVNNNGNITFENPLGTFTPFSITSSVPPIIAPFFADVDTRPPESRPVTYGTTTYGDRPAFCVNWKDVGYYATHSDKTNSFQLLLVDRSTVGAGDFDIVMNYGRIAWETGDASGGTNGFGGTPAAAGYSAGDGDAEHFFAFPGSLISESLLDSNPGGLIHGSRESQQSGRYIFPIRNGLAPGTAGLEGVISGPGDVPLAQAPVQACAVGGSCVTTRSGNDGHYSVSALPSGEYQITAFPPRELGLTPAGPAMAVLVEGATTNLDLTLSGPSAPPPGTSITDRGTTGDDIPVVYWDEPLTLRTQACSGGTVSYEIRLGGAVVRSGGMAEEPDGSGHFAATVPAFYPNHGNAVTSITAHCANPSDDAEIHFDIYIDPSGVVVDTRGNPVEGASVTLLRSDTADGPFEIVLDGGSEMSPSNRSNPDTTAADGTFGWDVIAGYYKVRASKAGCNGVHSGAEYVESEVLTIPPPVTDLMLTLDCGDGLSVSLAGSGTGSVTSSPAGIACGAVCSHDFANDATVELSASAGAGSTFTGWSGSGCSGTGVCRIALSGDSSVTATFTAAPSNPVGTHRDDAKPPRRQSRALKCRKGFKKKKIRGRARCVRHKKHARHKASKHKGVKAG